MKLVIDLNEEVYEHFVIKNEYTRMDIIAVHNALIGAIPIGKRRLKWPRIIRSYISQGDDKEDLND